MSIDLNNKAEKSLGRPVSKEGPFYPDIQRWVEVY
jgi:hypothetical protein